MKSGLRQLRMQHKLLQHELADKLGMSQTQIARMETFRPSRLQSETLWRIAEYFQIDAEEFYQEYLQQRKEHLIEKGNK